MPDEKNRVVSTLTLIRRLWKETRVDREIVGVYFFAIRYVAFYYRLNLMFCLQKRGNPSLILQGRSKPGNLCVEYYIYISFIFEFVCMSSLILWV